MVSTRAPGAAGTRWGEMGPAANWIENVSVGVQREKMHFAGCFICMWGNACIHAFVCKYLCVCV